MSQTAGPDGQAAEHEPIRPEATRAHAQAVGPQAGQQVLQMGGIHAQAMLAAGLPPFLCLEFLAIKRPRVV